MLHAFYALHALLALLAACRKGPVAAERTAAALAAVRRHVLAISGSPVS
jgi:hypothetical protein